MIRIKQFALAALTAFALIAGDPSQWGLSRKVNEYEGQHRVSLLASDAPTTSSHGTGAGAGKVNMN